MNGIGVRVGPVKTGVGGGAVGVGVGDGLRLPGKIAVASDLEPEETESRNLVQI
jgi:hypothetical protein